MTSFPRIYKLEENDTEVSETEAAETADQSPVGGYPQSIVRSPRRSIELGLELEVFPAWKRQQIENYILQKNQKTSDNFNEWSRLHSSDARSQLRSSSPSFITHWVVNVNEAMGLAQQAVLPAKRQYNNENSDSGIPPASLPKDKSEEDEDSIRAQYTKRSRDTSPVRKPLGCMDVVTEGQTLSKRSDVMDFQEYFRKSSEQVSNSGSSSCAENAEDSSFDSSDSTTLSTFEGKGCIRDTANIKEIHLLSEASQIVNTFKGEGDNFIFAVPEPPARTKLKSVVKSQRVSLAVGPRRPTSRCDTPRKALLPVRKRINELENTAACFDDDSVSESSNDREDDETDEAELSDSEKDIETSAETDTSESESIDVLPNGTNLEKIKAIRPSQFSYVPPFVNFCQHDEVCECHPTEIKSLMKWRLSTITPAVVRKTVHNSGFRVLKNTVEWTGHWGKHMKGMMFRAALKDYQKLNHLPGTFQIGRKDKLWKNYQRHLFKFGKENFGFLPKTYILPEEIKSFKTAWDATKGKPWIIKPPAGARGNGIRVINKWSQVPKKRSTVIQKYIAKPFLINSRKFDIRIYVLVTSFHPLKIYMYADGLVRFAPMKYSEDSKRVGDRYMHLTNYSVNKHCDLYTKNEDAEALEGHKWTLKSLWRYLKDEGHDVEKLWEDMKDIAIKTLVAAEDPITNAAFNLPSRYNGYELLGFDIILDEKLKPWLLEVNISPSLHSSSSLDLAVKGPLIREVFNIVGYHFPDNMPNSAKKKLLQATNLKLETAVFDRRLYSTQLSNEEKSKQITIKKQYKWRHKYLEKALENLTPDDIRYLIQLEDESSQCDKFKRIFPSLTSHEYLKFLEGPRYYNILFDAWVSKYGADKEKGIKRLQQLCNSKLHLQCVQNNSGRNTTLDNENNVNAVEEETETSRLEETASSTKSETDLVEDLVNGNGDSTTPSSGDGEPSKDVTPMPAHSVTNTLKSQSYQNGNFNILTTPV